MEFKRNSKQLARQKAEQAFKTKTQRLVEFAGWDVSTVLDELDTSFAGLSPYLVEAARKFYGENKISQGKKNSWLKRLWEAFASPFTAILIALALVSLYTDVIVAASGEKNPVPLIIILTIVLMSGILRFVQETRSGNAAARLAEMVKTTTAVERKRVGRSEIPLEEVVVGDIVYLAAGDMVPADVRILSAKDLFINQASLTGESDPVEKVPQPQKEGAYQSVTECADLAFMGSTVISGSASCVAVATGDDTLLGSIAKDLSEAKKEQTTFEKGVNSVSWVLIRFMLVMVPIVLLINGITKKDWLGALLFAISVAVGLTPQMLPMIVTTCLAKGAVSMSRHKTIIKDLNAIQNLGAMDVLCTDKTGTLTQDRVALEYHLDIHGKEDVRVLRHAFLNSYFQTGLKSLMDVSIIERAKEESETEPSLRGLAQRYEKVDEIPFDFDRRRLSVVVADKSGKTQMVTKGAVEEMLSICTHAEYNGETVALTDEIKKEILTTVDALNDDGMRVIAVAQKTSPSPVGAFSVADEKDMVLIGYLAFLDPPKETSAALAALREYGVKIKVLTGDNDRVTRYVCKKVGVGADRLLLGADIEAMDDGALSEAVKTTDVFAKLSPGQKARIVTAIRNNGHAVGFLGDGINDASAMKASDVGISVDNAVDIAKESADVILLEKNLMVLEEGIVEGRKVYANMIKYIKMTASSNFGNMFSVLAASAFLPFLPMASIHLILLNLIYDISCTAIPWDNVDREFLLVPRTWDSSTIGKFMVWIGPTSSVFDIATYVLMYFVICPAACGGQLFQNIADPAMRLKYIALFQAGWFVESMWTQTLVIHMIRTPKIPFIQSRASFPVVSLGLSAILVLTMIPFTPIGAALKLAPLPPVYFAYLALIIAMYMVLVTVVKKIYVRKYGELL